MQSRKAAARRTRAEGLDSTHIPIDLRPAVQAVRDTFRAQFEEWAQITGVLCKERMRDLDSEEPIIYPEYVRISAVATVRFSSHARKRTPPAVFQAFLDLFTEGMVEPACIAFRDLLKVASGVSNPVRWAEAQTKHLIRLHRGEIRHWMVNVCDIGSLVEVLATPGNLPELVRMEPAGFFPYDEARAWEPLGAQASRLIADLRADSHAHRLNAAVEQAARDAQVANEIERAASPSPVTPAFPIVPNGTAAKRKHTSRPASPAAKRSQTIARVAAMGYKNEEYFRQLDNSGVRPPQGWKVPSYAQAYRDKDLRQRVFKERYKAIHRMQK